MTPSHMAASSLQATFSVCQDKEEPTCKLLFQHRMISKSMIDRQSADFQLVWGSTAVAAHRGTSDKLLSAVPRTVLRSLRISLSDPHSPSKSMCGILLSSKLIASRRQLGQATAVQDVLRLQSASRQWSSRGSSRVYGAGDRVTQALLCTKISPKANRGASTAALNDRGRASQDHTDQRSNTWVNSNLQSVSPRVFRHSDCGNPKIGRKVLELLGFTLHHSSSNNSHEIFKWNDMQSEVQHQDKCKSYIEHSLRDVLAKKRLCVLDVAKRGSFLQAVIDDTIDGIPLLLRGRPDFLIVKESYQLDKNDLSGVVLAIEVKKPGGRASVYQGAMQLVALQARQPERQSVVLYTDCQHMWTLLFFNQKGGVCMETATSPASGFDKIRTTLDSEL